MSSSSPFRSRREQERAEMKNTLGYKIWLVMFVLLYPFIAVFTFLFSGVVRIFSAISRAISCVLAKVYAGTGNKA